MQGKEDRKRKNAKKVEIAEIAEKVKLELKLIYLKQNY